MKLVLLNALLLLAAISWTVERHHRLSNLRAQQQILTRQWNDYAGLAGTAHSKSPIDTSELLNLRQEHGDLMKLRSEAGRLRATAHLSVEELEKETQSALARAKEAEHQADFIQATFQAEDRSTITRAACGSLMSWARSYAKANQGKYPASFDQIKEWARTNPRFAPMFQAKGFVFDISPSSEARQLGITADAFELIPATIPPSSTDRVVVARERKPRQLPDGSWARVYGVANGGVEELHSLDPAFADAEKHLTEH